MFSVGGASLDDLRTEDGDLDLDRINALADDMLASRPGLRVKIHNGDQGMRGLQTRSRPAATWGDVLAGRD